MRRHWSLSLPLLLALLPSTRAAEAPAACEVFSWDIARELDMLSKPALPLAAANDTAALTGAVLQLDTHYDVALQPQAQVKWAASPAKSTGDNTASAGLLLFRAPHPGRYRIAITSKHWLDVVDAGVVIPSAAHEGHPGCELVRKIIEFDLPAGRDVIVQLSGGSGNRIGLLVSATDPS